MASSKNKNIMVKEMIIDIEEASKLLEFVNGRTPEAEVEIAGKMVGKFKGIVPEGKSSVEYLKERSIFCLIFCNS